MTIRIKFKQNLSDESQIPIWLELAEKDVENTEQFETMLEQLKKKGVQFYIVNRNTTYLIADHDDGAKAVQILENDEPIAPAVKNLIVDVHRRLIKKIEPEKNATSDIFEILIEKEFGKFHVYFHKTKPGMDWDLGIKFRHGRFLTAVIFVEFGRYTIRFGFK